MILFSSFHKFSFCHILTFFFSFLFFLSFLSDFFWNFFKLLQNFHFLEVFLSFFPNFFDSILYVFLNFLWSLFQFLIILHKLNWFRTTTGRYFSYSIVAKFVTHFLLVFIHRRLRRSSVTQELSSLADKFILRPFHGCDHQL